MMMSIVAGGVALVVVGDGFMPVEIRPNLAVVGGRRRSTPGRRRYCDETDAGGDLREVVGLRLVVIGVILHESKFIQNIVSVTEHKLNHRVLCVPQYQVGITSRVRNINLWLQDRSVDANILVIYGMGGIGKTTIAKIAYNLNFHRFDSSNFIANVKQHSEQINGILELQNQVISNILKGEKGRLYNVREGSIKINQAICSKRVLVVLDDVDKLDQFDALLGTRVFYLGSCDESSKLFSLHAFGQDHPIEGYVKQSERLVKRCEGLPLALQVLGSFLSACFFIGEKKDDTIKILEKCGLHPTVGIDSLIGRCLLTVEQGNKPMHQLIQDMRKEIVRQESPKEPGRRSRLWHHKDSLHILGFLKIHDLSHSQRLARTFNFSKLPNLEKLILKGCVGLLEVCESIGLLKGLDFLDLEDCTSLKNFQATLEFQNRYGYEDMLSNMGLSSLTDKKPP
ncbi:hypothetical protein RJ640_011945 [Escallonia rubra]|uniref:NB-ARC domain-containing protein n=1 Tax=Escallonia rubra TaxID=112253 RepID=A0AA88UW84_9ASTE|nr:hypothetical protein RJ640_011945 [Escallonia rubra]